MTRIQSSGTKGYHTAANLLGVKIDSTPYVVDLTLSTDGVATPRVVVRNKKRAHSKINSLMSQREDVRVVGEVSVPSPVDLINTVVGAPTMDDILQICAAIDDNRTHVVVNADVFERTSEMWTECVRTYVYSIKPNASAFAVLAVGIVLAPYAGLQPTLANAINNEFITPNA